MNKVYLESYSSLVTGWLVGTNALKVSHIVILFRQNTKCSKWCMGFLHF